jgi:predicted DNA-binding ribbon-helix-helix protein
LSQMHDEALEIHGEMSNFASLLRCSCLVYLERGAEAATQSTAA